MDSIICFILTAKWCFTGLKGLKPNLKHFKMFLWGLLQMWWRQRQTYISFESLCVFLCVTEQKVTALTFVVVLESLQHPTTEASQSVDSHLHHTPEINSFPPPHCSLFRSFLRFFSSPGWSGSCYHWQNACSYNSQKKPHDCFCCLRSRPSPDSVTGGLDLFHKVPAKSWTQKGRLNYFPNYRFG